MPRATTACTFWTSQLLKVLRPWCFFHLCLAPQQRAPFQHLNFQKCTENGVLCTFWLRHVLLRHSAVHFLNISTSKSALSMVFFNMLPPKLFQINVLRATTLRSHKTSEKTSFSRLFNLFAHLHTLSLSLLWSSFFFPSLLWLFPPLLFPSVHIILSEVWLLNFLHLCGEHVGNMASSKASHIHIYIYIYTGIVKLASDTCLSKPFHTRYA